MLSFPTDARACPETVRPASRSSTPGCVSRLRHHCRENDYLVAASIMCDGRGVRVACPSPSKGEQGGCSSEDPRQPRGREHYLHHCVQPLWGSPRRDRQLCFGHPSAAPLRSLIARSSSRPLASGADSLRCRGSVATWLGPAAWPPITRSRAMAGFRPAHAPRRRKDRPVRLRCHPFPRLRLIRHAARYTRTLCDRVLQVTGRSTRTAGRYFFIGLLLPFQLDSSRYGRKFERDRSLHEFLY